MMSKVRTFQPLNNYNGNSYHALEKCEGVKEKGIKNKN